MTTRNPMQPTIKDKHGRLRFKSNAIVRLLLDDNEGIGLNEIASMGFTQDDREQFAQLIGYSVSGFSELEYASAETVKAADSMLEPDAATILRDKAYRLRLEDALEDAENLQTAAEDLVARLSGKT